MKTLIASLILNVLFGAGLMAVRHELDASQSRERLLRTQLVERGETLDGSLRTTRDCLTGWKELQAKVTEAAR